MCKAERCSLGLGENGLRAWFALQMVTKWSCVFISVTRFFLSPEVLPFYDIIVRRDLF